MERKDSQEERELKRILEGKSKAGKKEEARKKRGERRPRLELTSGER